MKKLIVIGLLVLAASQAGAAVTTTGRFWWYGNFTALLSPQLAFVAMPGHRFEFYRDSGGTVGTAKGNVLAECFLGPVYTMKFGDNMKLKLGAWYYYMGFPSTSPTTFYSSAHNLEILPIIEYKWNKFTFANRIILHNTLYADGYADETKRAGYSLLAREMPSVTYALTDNLSLYFSDEIFVGVVGPADLTLVKPYGFSAPGFQTNRVYVGATYAFSPLMSIAPQYVYETGYSTDGLCTLTTVQHYVYITFNYVMKLFK